MRMARVDLFFGAGRVDRSSWTRFLAEVVTQRFPDGLTSTDAAGQWLGSRGLVRERSRVMVIFYKPGRAADAKVDAIRAIYKARFHQTSVLRADSSACVNF